MLINVSSWIFIVEGIITLLIAIMSYVFLVDFPDGNKPNWNFLSQKEIRFIVARVNADRGDADTEKFSWAKFLGAGLDWKIWAYGMLFGMTTTVTYALSYFLPLILRDGMGFSVGAAQCLVAPPYVAAGLLMYGCGWLGDKYHTRGPIMLFNFILCLIGVPLIGFVDHDHTAIRYFGVFLVCMGANANIPAIMT
jgi:nitrate/nitrite transporter NarK